MDPSTNQPVANPNVAPVPQIGAEQAPPQPGLAQPEQLVVAAPEIAPTPGANPAPVPAQAAQPAAVPTPPPVTNQVWSGQVHTDAASARAQQAQALAELPAEDSDLIEKAWVDKTEQVIEADKDNPHAEDEHQHVLSQTYLKKRFNLDVK